MSKDKYYVMYLDDYSAPDFTSFSKMYFGTMDEFAHFIRLLEKNEREAENHKDTIAAFYEFQNGNDKATHKVAYKDMPILSPVTVRGSNTFKFARKKWTHKNTWEWPRKMCAREVVVEVKLFKYHSRIYRAIRPSFKLLKDYSEFSGLWELRQEDFWGFPHMLELDPDGKWNNCRFFIVNEVYKDFAQACDDLYDETKINFEPVIDEVYGNG